MACVCLCSCPRDRGGGPPPVIPGGIDRLARRAGNDYTDGMVEERLPYRPIREGPAWQAARAYGIDVSLLEDSLQLTPLERMRTHARALDEALMLRDAVRKQHVRS